MDINTIVNNANNVLRDLGLSPSQITKEIAEAYGITGIGTKDNEVDAFRHAYASAVATYLMGESVAKAVGDYNEDRIVVPTDPVELEKYQEARNMDLWNNDVGREIGSTASSIAEIGERVAEAVRSHQTINGLDDTTKTWTEPAQQPEISIPDILTHPLGRIITGLIIPVPGTLIAQIGVEALVELFKSASTVAQRRDPLILDLDNDGAETIGVESGAHFDHDANGFAEQTGWVSPDDGLLVRDINGNGTIDTGRELFGDNTLLKDGTLATDGLQALADLDDNGDNKIDSQDAAFSQLKVWKDLNSDGISTADELKTLDELNIKSLNTTYTVTNITDSTGNTQTHQATYEKKLLMENS